MSKTKTGGKTRQGTTRPGKRLGVKVFGGEVVKSGTILLRQRGTKFHAGKNTSTGRDHTVFATKEGVVSYGVKLGKRVVSVVMR